MNTILSLIILIRLNSLKKDHNYIIADYIIKHIDEMPDMSIKQLSEECYVSTTSILKFCALTGFQTYSEFKKMLVSTIKTRKRQLQEKNQYLKSEDLLKHIELFANEQFDIRVFQEQTDQVIEQIKEHKTIYLYGATFPLILASSFVEDMALLGYYVDTVQSNFETKMIKRKPGVHIVVSLSGRFIEINRNDCLQISSMGYPTVIISRINEKISDNNYVIQLPHTISSQYDEIALLVLYDYILANV